MTKPFRILYVSDLHVGDYFGLWLPSYRLEGGGWDKNSGQAYLLDCWNDALEWAPKRVDMFVVGGDANAGENPAEGSTHNVTTDCLAQAGCAAELLKPLAKRAPKGETYLLAGTPYHEGRRSDGVKALAVYLKDYAHIWKSQEQYGWWLRKAIGDTILDASHAIPQTLVYDSTPLEREGQWALRNRDDREMVLVVRSHRHIYRVTKGAVDYCISTPCWQLQTPHAIQKSPNKLIPSLGLVLIEIEKGENGITDKARLYKHPDTATE